MIRRTSPRFPCAPSNLSMPQTWWRCGCALVHVCVCLGAQLRVFLHTGPNTCVILAPIYCGVQPGFFEGTVQEGLREGFPASPGGIEAPPLEAQEVDTPAEQCSFRFKSANVRARACVCVSE